MTGKAQLSAGVVPDMRDHNTVLRSSLPLDADGQPVRKCSRAKCNRPSPRPYKVCSSCRSYAREYQARQKKGAAQAAAYCAQMWAPKDGAK